ncbi:hypothetical protein [Bacteroides ihuae]|uniref:hypothetical protein n=1 Tax=Bacteroides ihuae TaxID=1852362 RepID=UPI0008D9ED42|nr:hypothetical protein [Bacteroides ihuae]
MKYIIIILLPLFLSACGTVRQSTFKLLSIDQTEPFITNNQCSIKLLFEGVTNEQLEFFISIKNNSTDTIQIDPSSFRYIPIYHKKSAITDSLHRTGIQCIDPQKAITELQLERDSLPKKNNPYSLRYKDTKTIAREGIITGTVALLLGQKVEDLEAQREDDEREWYEKQIMRMREVNSELDFFQNKALKPTVLLPNGETEGLIRFPMLREADEIQIAMPSQYMIQPIRYKQAYIKELPLK